MASVEGVQNGSSDAPVPLNGSGPAGAPNVPPVKQKNVAIQGCPTHVSVTLFADRVLVILTQLGKIGALVETRLVQGSAAVELLDNPIVHEARLLGPEDPLHSVYASEVCRLLGRRGIVKPILVGLGLKRGTAEGASPDSSERGLSAEKDRMEALMKALEELLA